MNALDGFGIEARVSATGVGVIAEIGPDDGDVIVLRAEMDALAVHETNDVRYRSKNDGVMHACGHDGTTSGLVHAAAIMKEYNDKKGLPNKVRCVFQPAEENGEGGAQAMIIQDGVLANAKLACGEHKWPDYYAGEVASREGLTQNSHVLTVGDIEGEEDGHSARPQESSNTVLVTAKMVVELDDEIKEFYADYANPPIVGWTGVKSVSESANAIPKKGWFRATVRYGSIEDHENGKPILENMFGQKLRKYDMRGSLNFSMDIPPVVNTRWANEQGRAVMAKELGSAAVKLFPGSTGGDDMALFGSGVGDIEGAPEILYMQIGTAPRGTNPKTTPRLHASNFDMHPDTTIYSTTYFAAMGIAGLSGHPGIGGRGHQLQLTK